MTKRQILKPDWGIRHNGLIVTGWIQTCMHVQYSWRVWVVVCPISTYEVLPGNTSHAAWLYSDMVN